MQHQRELKKKLPRKELLTASYFNLLDRHLEELVAGSATEMLELNDIARELCVSHQHLIAVIRETSGEHPCHFYIARIIEKAKSLLADTNWSVAEIARVLTYDPSNFTKFFKKYAGVTPGQYRAALGAR